jgi:hypothetical protein
MSPPLFRRWVLLEFISSIIPTIGSFSLEAEAYLLEYYSCESIPLSWLRSKLLSFLCCCVGVRKDLKG